MIKKLILLCIHLGPVVQLDRMIDFGSVGCRFESCRGHNDIFNERDAKF